MEPIFLSFMAKVESQFSASLKVEQTNGGVEYQFLTHKASTRSYT